MVGDDVDDVMQTAYLQAFRGWRTFDGRSAPTTWLYSIAVNVALDHLRRRRTLVPFTRSMTAETLDDVAAAAAESVDLARGLQRLPVDQRVVLLLIDAQSFTHEQAANVLGVPVGTIGSRLSRARTAMRTSLEGDRRD